MSLGSFSLLGFTRVRPRLCQWVNSRSPCVSLGLSRVLGSLTRVLGVVGFIRAVGVTRALPGGRWAHPGTFCLLARALGFVGFIQPRCVHSSAPCMSLVLSRAFGFTRALPGGCRVHPRSFCSLALALCVVGFISGFEFTRTRQWGRCIHVGLLGSLARALGVDWFIGGRWVRSRAR